MALLLVIAFSTNTGIVVNDRIRMQETADLATYAVAYSEAASLNDITKKNKRIAEVAQDCRRVLQHGGVPWATPCNCGPTDPQAEVAVQLCKVDLDVAILDFVSTASYSNTVTPALKAGKATARANFDGVERRTTFFDNIPGSPTAMGTYWVTWTTNYAGGGAIPSIADFRQMRETAFNYQFMQFCGSYCAPSGLAMSPTYVLPTWFYKDDKDPDVWVAGRVAGTPTKRFLDSDYRSGGRDKGYFGASSTGGDDLLVAYAVAKPYDGSVGPSNLSGLQANGNSTPTPVYSYRGIEYPKLSMYDQYRARMAGIQDELTGGLDPATLVLLDGIELGKSWDTSRFEH
jgi:hypothetical protein